MTRTAWRTVHPDLSSDVRYGRQGGRLVPFGDPLEEAAAALEEHRRRCPAYALCERRPGPDHDPECPRYRRPDADQLQLFP